MLGLLLRMSVSGERVCQCLRVFVSSEGFSGGHQWKLVRVVGIFVFGF